jgi:ABC-2 type transport system permease protein
MKPFAYEWARLRTLRSTWIMASICLVFSVLGALLSLVIANNVGDESGGSSFDEATWIGALTGIVPTVVGICATLIGAYAFGHEYRFGTIRPTLTTIPARAKVALAKASVPAMFVFVLAGVAMLATIGMSWLFVHNKIIGSAFGGSVWRALLGVALFCAGNALIGAGLCAITRSQVFTLVSTILFKIIIEPIIVAVLVLVKALSSIKEAARYLPYQSGEAMFSAPPSATRDTKDFDFQPLSPLVGGLVFFGFAFVICALGIWRFNRSDA